MRPFHFDTTTLIPFSAIESILFAWCQVVVVLWLHHMRMVRLVCDLGDIRLILRDEVLFKKELLVIT